MIQFITHSNERYGYVEGARLALEGGCRWVQLRMKDASEEEFVAAAEQIGKLCREHEAVFVLDDHAELVEPTACISARTTCRLTRRVGCSATTE